jgi:hypothetical protein
MSIQIFPFSLFDVKPLKSNDFWHLAPQVLCHFKHAAVRKIAEIICKYFNLDVLRIATLYYSANFKITQGATGEEEMVCITYDSCPND